MSYEIRWNLLSDDELDSLREVGVEMHSAGMNFTRTPTWEEFTIVFAYLSGLERRTNQKENHIAFAIGDCLNAGSDFFGESKVDEWLREFLKLQAMRDTILNMTGGTVIFLQEVEQQIKLCCAAIRLKGLKLTFEDFLSTDPSRRKKTLGQLIQALKQNGIFVPEFEERLTNFVNSRNEFIHNLWVEQGRHASNVSGLPPKEEFKAIYEFIQSLIREAHYIRNVFRGFQYDLMSGAEVINNLDKDTSSPFRRWAKYIAEFREVLRERPKDM